MKRSLKSLTAALAAVTAMTCAALPAYAAAAPNVSRSVSVTKTTGGWKTIEGSLSMNKNPEARNAFKKVTKNIPGVSYKAIAALATQVVAGTNYAILCCSTEEGADPRSDIKVIYIYEDLRGKVEIIGFTTIISDSIVKNSFTANTGKYAMSSNKDVYKYFKKAMKGSTDITYEPAAYLGSRKDDDGTTYLVLCRSRKDDRSQYEYSLVKVYRDSKGKVAPGEAVDLPLGEYDEA